MKTLLLVATLLIVPFASAQRLQGLTRVQSATGAPSKAAVVDSSSLVIAELRAQNRLMRDYDQRLLATVYWTLGSVVLLGGLLVGFGWNANSRSYERDRAALRQELQGLAREDAAKLQEQLLTMAAQSAEKLDQQVALLNESMEKRRPRRLNP